MAATKALVPQKRPRKLRDSEPHGSASKLLGEVLTLADAAEFLRVSERAVLNLVDTQQIPARQIGDEWRFLKSALREWLATSPTSSRKDVLLSLAGKYADDPTLNEILKVASRNRGRPMGKVDE